MKTEAETHKPHDNGNKSIEKAKFSKRNKSDTKEKKCKICDYSTSDTSIVRRNSAMVYEKRCVLDVYFVKNTFF